MERNAFEWVTVVLVIVGAINWGLVGAFDFNLVWTIFSSITWLMKTVYILVGLAGIWELVGLFRE
ncbi:DUF378 domain-containing protein [Candidatus Pacearchaeota archaeon]|nr:DUF378 domain-containing protein [Candidatus Pacearchaeota archaeon]